MTRRNKEVDLTKHLSASEVAEEVKGLWPEIHRLVSWANDLLEKNHLSERIGEAWKSQS